MFRDQLRKFRDAEPGRRFQSLAEEQRKANHGRSGTARTLRIIGGVALIVIGLSIGWLPGPGGFVAIIGLIMLLAELPLVARWIDRMELSIRRRIGCR